MKQFNNILIVYQGELQVNQKWFNNRLRDAKDRGARLRLLEVDAVLTGGIRSKLLAHLAPGFRDSLLKFRTQEMRKTLATLRKGGVRAYGKIARGNPLKAVIREAERHQCDLIVVVTSKEHDAAKITAGLVRLSPVPVVVMRPYRPRKNARLLAAVKVEGDAAGSDLMTRAILGHAVEIARSEGADLHIAAAWTVPGEATLASPRLNIPHEEILDIGRRAQAEKTAALERLISELDLDGINHTVHLQHGKPDAVIGSLTKRLKPGLIVMGGAQQAAIGGALFGNTTTRVMQAAGRPVMAVQPPAREAARLAV
jgi:nucleotide-binding universal stress UspA family protein